MTSESSECESRGNEMFLASLAGEDLLLQRCRRCVQVPPDQLAHYTVPHPCRHIPP